MLIINWKSVSKERIADIVSSIYADNMDEIDGMAYREYAPDMAEKVNKIFAFVDGRNKNGPSKHTKTPV